MILVRNSTGNGRSKWHIYQASKFEEIHHNQKPVCGGPHKLNEMKNPRGPTDQITAPNLATAKALIQSRLGTLCQKCSEYIKGYNGKGHTTQTEKKTEKPRNMLDDMKQKTREVENQ